MQMQKASCLLPVFLAVVLPFGHALAAADTHHEADSLPRTHETNLGSTAGQPLAIDAGGVTIQFGGFVKLDVLQDFDPVDNPDQFKGGETP